MVPRAETDPGNHGTRRQPLTAARQVLRRHSERTQGTLLKSARRTDAVKRTLCGDLSADLYKWISREYFNLFRDRQIFTALCRSFGSNVQDYLCRRDTDSCRRARWRVLSGGSPYDIADALRDVVTILEDMDEKPWLRASRDHLLCIQSFSSLEQVEGMKCTKPESVTETSMDYAKVRIPKARVKRPAVQKREKLRRCAGL